MRILEGVQPFQARRTFRLPAGRAELLRTEITTNFLDQFFGPISWTLTIASFRIGVPSILFHN